MYYALTHFQNFSDLQEIRCLLLTCINYVDSDSAPGPEVPAPATPSSTATTETPTGGATFAVIQTSQSSAAEPVKREISPIRKGRFSVVTHKPDEVEEITAGVIGLEELSSTPSSIAATLRHDLHHQSAQQSMLLHHPQNLQNVVVAAAAASTVAPSVAAAPSLQANNNMHIDNTAQQQEFLQRRFSQCLATIPGQSFHGPPVFVTAGPAIQVGLLRQ